MSIDNLRHRAEEFLEKHKDSTSSISPDEVRRLAFELSVHQVELEMQNEELRQAQLSLAESQREFYNLFDLAPIGFMVLDREGHIHRINRDGARLLGSEASELIGRLFPIFVHNSCCNRYYEHVAKVLRSGEVQTCELEIASLDGNIIPVRFESVVRQFDDRKSFIRSALVDQTENRRAWEALEKANLQLKIQAGQMRKIAEELTYAEQRERQRLALLLHDHLQQLLVAAKINLELAQSKIRSVNLPSKLTSAVELCQKAEELLSQSLSISRSLAIELSPPVLKEGSLHAVLNWLVRRMKEMHGLTVRLVMDVPDLNLPPNINVSLFEIIRELLLNVVKHSGVKTAEVALHRVEGNIRVIVADRGKGFNNSKLENENSATSFGMLTARHRLSWMQGSMRVESAPGQGCRIEILVPETSDSISPHPQSAPTAVSPAAVIPDRLGGDPRIRVLVADDHHVLREGLSHIILMEPGMLVVGEASNGREAVELARQTHPDIVVMDINMPELNGIEATRQITSEDPHVQVIGLSMHEPADMTQTLLRAGGAAFLSKGSSSQELITTIRQCAGKEPVHA